MTDLLEEINLEMPIHPEILRRKWGEHTDARNYMILGDPAARLSLTDKTDEISRPALATVTIENKPLIGPQPAPTPNVTLANIPMDDEQSFRPIEGRPTPVRDANAGGLRGTLDRLIRQLTNSASELVQNTTSLEVKTYTSSDLDKFKFRKGEFVGEQLPTLRALTHIKLDGDHTSVIPENDPDLWQQHLQIVAQAQAHRAEMLRVILEGAAKLMGNKQA